jgi:hypothetical protein
MDFFVDTSPHIGSWNAKRMVNRTYALEIPQTQLEWNTTYRWWINITDGVHWINSTYVFTTESENFPPYIESSEPNNGEHNVSISINSLNITITDPNGDLMNYYFSLGGTSIEEEMFNITHNNISVHLPYQLEYGIEYNWWLNITDAKYWTNN